MGSGLFFCRKNVFTPFHLLGFQFFSVCNPRSNFSFVSSPGRCFLMIDIMLSKKSRFRFIILAVKCKLLCGQNQANAIEHAQYFPVALYKVQKSVKEFQKKQVKLYFETLGKKVLNGLNFPFFVARQQLGYECKCQVR